MSNQPQREKATEVVQVKVTLDELNRVKAMANEQFNGNVSGWARRELLRAADTQSPRKSGA